MRSASATRILRRSARPVCSCSRAASIRWSSTSAAPTKRQWSTPLAKELAEAITTTGPIPIAAYMRQCLTSPTGGYYTTQRPVPGSVEQTDQFGKAGDFVTSPEISQIFGELVGIFFVAEWLAQGRPSAVQLIELGPGRGTLMSDILRAVGNFKDMANNLESLWLVEASPALREAQKKLLCGETSEMVETEWGWSSTCAHPSLSRATVNWVEDMIFLPKDTSKTPFIVAHEFFDALPIHAFQSVSESEASATQSSTITTSAATSAPQPSKPSKSPQGNIWRELLVSPTRPPSAFATTTTTTTTNKDPSSPAPDFELTVARHNTPHASLLPSLSPRYKALLQPPHAAGTSIEISPESLTTVATLAQLIGGRNSSSPAPSSTQLRRPRPDAPPTEPAVTSAKKTPSGAALIIDYGPADTVPVNSLRGIRAHRSVSPFAGAGQVDLSADVDFLALAETALAASDAVEVHGPVEQAAWLRGMGGEERLKALVRRAGADSSIKDQSGGDEIKKRIETGWSRLVDRGPSGMGKVYKCLAILPWHGAVKGAAMRRPVGFGGDVAASS